MARPRGDNPTPQALYYREWRKTEACKRCRQKEKERTSKDPADKKRRALYQKKWAARNLEHKRESFRKWYHKHRAKRRAIVKASYQKLRQEALVRYSSDPPTCKCCCEKNIIFLTIDHINGDGAEHRRKIGLCGVTNPKGKVTNFPNWLKKNGWPEGFQVLCFNCNFAKSHGGCPHQLSITTNQ